MSLAVTWTLQRIESETRLVSGQLSAAQLSSTDLDFYINSFYQYDLPRLLKIEELYKQYTFPLFQGQAVYDLPGDYNENAGPFTHVEPKIYVDGQAIFYTQDTNVYYSRIPKLFTDETEGYGNGITTVWNYTTINSPIVSNQPASVLVTDGVETFTDTGALVGTVGTMVSNLTPGGTGVVNYATGDVDVVFLTAPALNAPITVTYHFEQLAPPNTCLFYNRQFNFYPTPNTAFQCRIDAYIQPQPLVNASDVPVKNEWGEIIAIGAARKILRRFGQIEKYAELKAYFDEEFVKLLSDTDNQLMSSRSYPRC